MIELLAKQAVQIKCRFPGAGLTGEYEYDYACGLMTKIIGFNLLESFEKITDLKEYTMPKVEEFKSEDEKIKLLIGKMHDFVVEHEEVNEQIMDLYRMGFEDGTI